MSNLLKEPSIKLIPSDPMTNTILIIYCVSSSGASVPYKSSWRRVHPKKNKVEDIKHHNGSSYRCSPLDIDHFIEATVNYQHMNTQVSRIVQSNVVKVSRELKERRMYLRQPILCRVQVQQIPIQLMLFVKENALHMIPASNSHNHLTLLLPIEDIHVETQSSQLTFKLTFKNKLDDFVNLASEIIGWRPQLSSQELVIHFGSDLNRDIILLGIAEVNQRKERFQNQALHFPLSNRNIQEKYTKIATRDQEDKNERSKNKSQTSYSPSSHHPQKFKLVSKAEMKRSYTKAGGIAVNQKKPDAPVTLSAKVDNNQNHRERQYLNVFEDQDLQFLNASVSHPPKPQINSNDNIARTKTQAAQPNLDQPSINLRGSFEELQKSFNSNINQEMLDRAFGIDNESASSRKLHEELSILRKQNEALKKQNQAISLLAKENNSLKRKYLQMKQEINRLEMERKVILTDKLRCEVNWHKEIQEKEQIKKELQSLKEMLKNNPLHSIERSLKTNSFHDHSSNYDKKSDKRGNSRSPNQSFYK